MNGMLYDTRAQNVSASVAPLVRLYSRYLSVYGKEQAYFKLNEDAFVAQFAVTTNSTKEPWASTAFEFCGFDCAIVNILVNDANSLTVTQYYYQLHNGSCANPIPSADWYVNF